MKEIVFVVAFLFTGLIFGQEVQKDVGSVKVESKIVEVSCGQCQFKMEGKGCDLAVKIEDKTYYVDGSGIDDHGDAHAEDGFCLAVRKAKVTGVIVNGRFKVDSFELIKEETE